MSSYFVDSLPEMVSSLTVYGIERRAMELGRVMSVGILAERNTEYFESAVRVTGDTAITFTPEDSAQALLGWVSTGAKRYDMTGSDFIDHVRAHEDRGGRLAVVTAANPTSMKHFKHALEIRRHNQRSKIES